MTFWGKGSTVSPSRRCNGEWCCSKVIIDELVFNALYQHPACLYAVPSAADNSAGEVVQALKVPGV